MKSRFDKFCTFWIWVSALYFGFRFYLAFDRHMEELPLTVALFGCCFFGCAGGAILIYFGDKLYIRIKRHFEGVRHERNYQRVLKDLRALKEMEYLPTKGALQDLRFKETDEPTLNYKRG